MAGYTANDQRTCFEFAKRGSCHFKNCRYAHVRRGEQQPTTTDRGSERRGGHSNRNNRTDDFGELSAWKRQVRDSQTIRPLGSQLGQFFTTARKLIQNNAGSLQDVIQGLAGETGLKRIQELIQRDYTSIPVSTKRDVFVNQMLPFMEMVTHADVLGSLVLEQAVGTIYNCIFGVAGRRGEPFLGFLADAVRLEIEQKGNEALTYLELSLQVFWHVVELNSTAFIQEPLKPLAQRFADLAMTIHALDAANSLHQSCQYLERLQRRLDIGLSLPTLSRPPKQLPTRQVPVVFVTQKDPPGGRHDNDHADICKIKIMPTFQEILSSRTEYLPVKDPRQWHVGGLAGLLDRNFRLLREDTVGQLRDAIHAELQPSKNTGRGQTRTHVYRQVVFQGVEFHKFSGLQFLICFPQPANINGMGKKKVAEWWELSKRLQPSALVCLIDPQGFAVFCTVATPDRPRPRSKAAEDERGRLTGSLSEDPNVASVLLELVEPTEDNWQYILDRQASGKGRGPISLVEFPGILLPSFQPTLLALQKMQKAADIPMSGFLAPGDPNSLSLLVDVPPPVYATAPGFSFDLKCLMDNGASLKVQHSQPVDLETLRKESKLDDAQASALVNTLQRRIGLIQGPPGTGKSFTGVALIKVLLANKAKVKKGLGPIICVCYTNHALDQLLEDLLNNSITSQIVRIGAQSKSERLKPLNLRTVVREVEKTRGEKQDQYHLHSELDSLEGSEQSLKHYLQKSHPSHYRQLFGQEEDGFQRQRARGSRQMQSWLRGGRGLQGKTRGFKQLREVHVNMMTPIERRILYAHWLEECRKRVHSDAQEALSAHAKTKASWDRIRDEIDLRCLRTADVIGVTTTGLARSLAMLRRLPSKVLLCEEAGEVLEAHLLTSLLPSLEQVILIGDHQQLRPQIQNYELSRENTAGQRYSLDRSLFERLVEPDDGVGRRMHPSISRLIRDTLYPRLHDAPSVSEYPEVIGMRKRLFWLDHRCPEGVASGQEAVATSHWNDYEIDLAVALVNHLLRQGTYQSGEIAVLTPYLGQLHRMRRKLSQSFTITLGERDQEDLDNAGFAEDEAQPAAANAAISRSTLLQTLRVATVDNFQGEEAKVVVISLVRSNNQNRCGFLRTPNRINVLLSRAKHGIVDMWGKVLDMLEVDGNLGPSLDLSCPRHPETLIACGKRLECGHPCKQKCHSDMLHMAVYCPEQCQRPQKGCTHPCPKLSRYLPCGHQMASLPCWQSQDLSTVPHCNHKVTVPCHIDCQSLLPCGHSCKRQCSSCTKRTTEGPQVDHGACIQKYVPCPPCAATCDPCAPCAVSQCLSSCPHSTCSMPCAAPCDHIPCSLRCEKALPCGHQCPSVCGELCPPGIFCQVCGSDSIKDTAVDFILGELYREIDLTENPCIFPQCGHFLTIESMDAQMDLKKHYIVGEKERPVAIASSSQPFAIDDIRTCATCRGSLRSLSRYGRLVRRALLDEATKKFILYLNQQYIPMAQDLPRRLSQLHSREGSARTAMGVYQANMEIRIEGSPENQVQLMSSHINRCDKQRWKELVTLRHRITQYKKIVKEEEQPFNQVRNMVEDARRRKRVTGDFEFDENVLQTKGHLQAVSLLLRLDTALVADFLSLKGHVVRHSPGQSELHVNLSENREESKKLIQDAASSHRVLQQTEGNLFLAQLCALERQNVSEPTQAEALLHEGTAAIKEAQRLCDRHPQQTRGLAEEIEGTKGMLRGATFYAPVSNEERLAVLGAMAREFRGTGHWYYCANGHPFTIGECGAAMQLSRCPECGSTVGGQHHQAAAGVVRAGDMEEALRDMHL
ncbi:hypothetical protein BJX76DRAFT_365548 [Aspergillus varians]